MGQGAKVRPTSTRFPLSIRNTAVDSTPSIPYQMNGVFLPGRSQGCYLLVPNYVNTIALLPCKKGNRVQTLSSAFDYYMTLHDPLESR